LAAITEEQPSNHWQNHLDILVWRTQSRLAGFIFADWCIFQKDTYYYYC